MVLVAWLVASCSVYDAGLVRQQPNGIVGAAAGGSGGFAGSTGRDAGPVDSGSNLGSEQMNDDAGTPMLTCGDGLVSALEKCDIGIETGVPGSCPTSCPMMDKCVPRVLNGSDCQSECVIRPVICSKEKDGCCAPGCTPENDPDCSASCGDGIIQASVGETCEASSATPCKTSDADCDDKNSCTTDMLTGSAANCNAACVNTPITTPKSGDGCCPPGANANTDSDCKPVCGNKVKEGSEQCDGTDGCSATCTLTLQPNQIACMQSATDDCEKCACISCTATETACRLSLDPNSNNLCNAVLVCARQNNCTGTACYCGNGLCVPPAGMCVSQIQGAAASTDPLVINQKQNDQTTPLGKAYYADTCRVQQCMSSCR